MNAIAPLGWKVAKLGECCEIVSGGTPKRDVPEYWGGSIPWVTPKDIGVLEDPDFMEPPERITELGLRVSSATLLPVGAVLLSSRAPIGHLAIAAQPMATNQGFKSLIPGADLDSRFLYYTIKKLVPLIQERGSGTTFKEVSRSVVAEIPIAFPRSIERQHHIAAVLDKATDIRRKRQQARAMVDGLLKSVFFEMFGDLELNSKDWEAALISEVLETEPQNGLYRPSCDYGTGTQILRIDSFYDGYLAAKNPLKRLRIDLKTIAKYLLFEGDIIINRVNSLEYLGKSVLIESLEEDTVYESNMMRFRVKEDHIHPRFLVDQMHTQFVKRQILRAAKDAVNQSSINQTDVMNIQIRIPPILLQRRYAEIVERNRLNDGNLEMALRQAEYLFLSISQRAFRGEL